MKIIKIILLLCIFNNVLFAQCNTSVLYKRTKAPEVPMKEKVLGIRLIARVYTILITDINTMGAKAGKQMKSALDQNKKPNLLSYINTIKKEKKKIENQKQTAELKTLDELVYCYLDFELQFYNSVQNIINKNKVSNIRPELSKIMEPFFTKEDAKIDELNKEIKSIETKYPITVTHK